VGSESDRRVQIANSGTTAKNGARSYALGSRVLSSQTSARIDVLYTYSKLQQSESRFARPEKNHIIYSQK
jgi:hypothetical protein